MSASQGRSTGATADLSAQQSAGLVATNAAAAIVCSDFSFAMPNGYATNVLTTRPGGYVFSDFVCSGGPLVVTMIVAFSIALARAHRT
jgi:di/tricarboxylate transporter